MKSIVAAVIAALALSNVAFAQGNADRQSASQDRFEFLVKYSPL